MHNRAGLRATGADVPKDEAEAVRLYQQEAASGSPGACVELGLRYRDGRGVERDSAGCGQGAGGWAQTLHPDRASEAREALAAMAGPRGLRLRLLGLTSH